MAIPRQPPGSGDVAGTGRVNQKRRTRAAIVGAAKRLVEEGATPTVAQAAEAALVSRTTAYRYFPTQDSLLLELAVDLDVDDAEALAASPLAPGEEPADRIRALLDLLHRHVYADELRYRQLLRTYLDLGLTAVADGDAEPVVRVGRRVGWYRDALASLRPELGDAAIDRLVAGLSLLGGAESMVVLRDVCHLSPDDALVVTRWAADVLIAATLDADAPRRRQR